MIVFFKKLMNMVENLLSKKSNTEIKENIELDITWGDISSGVSSSKNGSVIAYSMRRNGMFGYATENKLILETGEIYSPVELSDHWEAYINSPKMKPRKIVYFSE
jgi:hypothetical protein